MLEDLKDLFVLESSPGPSPVVPVNGDLRASLILALFICTTLASLVRIYYINILTFKNSVRRNIAAESYNSEVLILMSPDAEPVLWQMKLVCLLAGLEDFCCGNFRLNFINLMSSKISCRQKLGQLVSKKKLLQTARRWRGIW